MPKTACAPRKARAKGTVISCSARTARRNARMERASRAPRPTTPTSSPTCLHATSPCPGQRRGRTTTRKIPRGNGFARRRNLHLGETRSADFCGYAGNPDRALRRYNAKCGMPDCEDYTYGGKVMATNVVLPRDGAVGAVGAPLTSLLFLSTFAVGALYVRARAKKGAAKATSPKKEYDAIGV
mmetsp:Transcript_427/g.1089  ORF Transcript_427/g.1089 Transcript_427/m.1089 type:complete len:183 (-) Transcript_427:124-672(-)